MEESTIRLMHYDPRWPQEFEQTRSNVLQSCQGWVTAVEHIGSTAISGLIAQPIIDVIAAVEDAEGLAPASMAIEGLNFRRVSAPEWIADEPGCLLEKPRHGTATHRLLLVVRESPPWRRAIRLRERLRADPDTAVRFEETKVARWRRGEGDPQRYEADKAIFFAHLEDQISGE